MPTSQLEPVARSIRRWVGAEATRRLTDAELVERFARRRDEAAFAALTRRHGRLVLGVCRRVLRHEQDAEDSFQATFILLAQKMESIRKGQSVASWLYGVAYRMAKNAKRKAARRRAHERRGTIPQGGVGGVSPVAQASLQELQAVLDEEVNRLPESYRAVFVLCCLQGKSQSEAAKELGWKEGTVAGRLSRARRRLQTRLTRRGVTLSAALAASAVVEESVLAAVPAALTSATVDAAMISASGKGLAGAVSGAVAALVKGMSKAMVLAKVKVATGVVLAASMVASGAGFAVYESSAPSDTPQKQQKPTQRRSTPPAEVNSSRAKVKNALAIEIDGDRVTVRGTVVDPDGKPVNKAKLFIESESRTHTGTDGRFELSFLKSEVTEMVGKHRAPERWRFAQIIATADGYGPQTIAVEEIRKENLTLKLARDDAPIRGRILNLEGKPVAGVTVHVDELFIARTESLDGFLNDLRQRAGGYAGENRHFRYSPHAAKTLANIETSSDQHGRFVLKGIGRERVVWLTISGPTIETREVRVRTRPGETIQRDATYYGVEFDHFAAPCQQIIGVVREKESGNPIPGAIIQSYKLAGSNVHGHTKLRTVADQQGRFQLTGMPKGDGNLIRAAPPEGQPFLMLMKPVPAPQGIQPATVDFELPRGVQIKGRAIDKDTGKPVRANIHYCLFEPVAGFEGDRYYENRANDGAFSLIVPPTRGILAARAMGDAYVVGSGADEIKSAIKNGLFPTHPRCMVDGYHRLIEINPRAEDKELVVDIVFDPGLTVSGTILDVDGKPLAGARGRGLRNYGAATSFGGDLPTAEFTARGIKPGQPHRLQFAHMGKRLAGTVLLKGDEKEHLTIKLEPCATITGRLVDSEGRVLPNGEMASTWRLGQNTDNLGSIPGWRIYSDKDGRFRIDGLAAGLKYTIRVIRLPGNKSGFICQDLDVKSGETKDLGDVLIKPRE